jgi:hypothetical protein
LPGKVSSQFFQPTHFPRHGQNPGTLCEKSGRDGQTDTGAGTGDNRQTSFEIVTHRYLS